MISDKIERVLRTMRNLKAEGCLTEEAFDEGLAILRGHAEQVRSLENGPVPLLLRGAPAIDDPTGKVVPLRAHPRPRSAGPSHRPPGGFPGAALVAGLLALGALLLPEGATARPSMCHERHLLLDHIEREYGETPAEWGLDNSGAVIELLRAPDGASWSLLMTTPTGVSCLLASGFDWESKMPAKRGAKAAAKDEAS